MKPMKCNYIFNCYRGVPEAFKAWNISATYVNMMELEDCFVELEFGRRKIPNLL